jgi:hypothetical protein
MKLYHDYSFDKIDFSILSGKDSKLEFFENKIVDCSAMKCKKLNQKSTKGITSSKDNGIDRTNNSSKYKYKPEIHRYFQYRIFHDYYHKKQSNTNKILREKTSRDKNNPTLQELRKECLL